MLEYPVQDAIVLLSKNLATAKLSLQQVEDDLDFLKDQCTTIEVGILSKDARGGASIMSYVTSHHIFLNAIPKDMARVYNWDVKERRKAKKA